MAEEPAEGATMDGEPGKGKEEKKLDYCKEISEEQLTAFYEKAGDNEEAAKYMALDILKLPSFTYDGKIGMVLDYFVGILMFGQEEHMSPPHTLLMYQLGIETLENIKCEAYRALILRKNHESLHSQIQTLIAKSQMLSLFLRVFPMNLDCLKNFRQHRKGSLPHDSWGGLPLVPMIVWTPLHDTEMLANHSGFSIKKTEKKFKNLIFRWSVKVKNTNYVTQLTTIELQKIVPFFMTTVFQHYKLFYNCFNREALQWKYHEELFIEVPENILYPLKDFDTMEEIDEDKQARDEYKKAWAEWEAERLTVEARAQWLLENPLFPPDPRRVPENLDEYIDFSVRDKVEEVFNLMQEQYGERRTIICGRVQTLKENDSNSPYWRRLKTFGIKP